MPSTRVPKRPDMRDYFRARIDWHTHGMSARTVARLPHGVARVIGDVTDSRIVVVMRDGSEWAWSGGKYAARKVNGCYAPTMPKPTDA